MLLRTLRFLWVFCGYFVFALAAGATGILLIAIPPAPFSESLVGQLWTDLVGWVMVILGLGLVWLSVQKAAAAFQGKKM